MKNKSEIKRNTAALWFLVRREERDDKHSQQLRPQDHGHRFSRVVAAESQLQEVAGAAGLGAKHASGAPDGRQVEILGLAGSHPDLVPQCVVNHAVALLTAKRAKRTSKSSSSNL